MVTCIHFEPFGWQLTPNYGQISERREYDERNDYNRNLIDVINDEVHRGRIQVVRMTADLIGVNPSHPTSLLMWRNS